MAPWKDRDTQGNQSQVNMAYFQMWIRDEAKNGQSFPCNSGTIEKFKVQIKPQSEITKFVNI